MSRTTLTLTMAGVAAAAAALGCAAGMLLAPASGSETRRRLAWRMADERRALARAAQQAIERATTLARKEIERRLACAEKADA